MWLRFTAIRLQPVLLHRNYRSFYVTVDGTICTAVSRGRSSIDLKYFLLKGFARASKKVVALQTSCTLLFFHEEP